MDEEEIQIVTVSLAAAKEICKDVNCILVLKEHESLLLRDIFLFCYAPDGFSRSLVKHCSKCPPLHQWGKPQAVAT